MQKVNRKNQETKILKIFYLKCLGFHKTEFRFDINPKSVKESKHLKFSKQEYSEKNNLRQSKRFFFLFCLLTLYHSEVDMLHLKNVKRESFEIVETFLKLN